MVSLPGLLGAIAVFRVGGVVFDTRTESAPSPLPCMGGWSVMDSLRRQRRAGISSVRVSGDTSDISDGNRKRL